MKPESLPFARFGVLRCIAFLTFLVGAHGSQPDGPISLTVSTGGGNKSSPVLYGVMFEVSISVKSLVVFCANIARCRRWTILVWDQTPVSKTQLNLCR